jgi:hypothetical protein
VGMLGGVEVMGGVCSGDHVATRINDFRSNSSYPPLPI